jgi:hypothetical protein
MVLASNKRPSLFAKDISKLLEKNMFYETVVPRLDWSIQTLLGRREKH